ncbi:hypothetical protein Emin_1245 [Elusimicrobium minutum Pei191]|uniref:Lipoprotein n=1 Tax=Elusimicrobium minutum (strain Pei191) TaxID=445932 RepID=B2KE49_ELUMP|nr:hypothetical protein [Elusimicrobium minutum]ACC98795.1 hypothetical protein Emin_1245 [Elusimicrobium minutum Pei191]
MKKLLAVMLVCVLLIACGGNPKTNIVMLSKSDLNTMTGGEVTSFYKASNKDLLNSLVYNYGGEAYDKLVPVFNNMDAELTAMSKVTTTKEEYYLKLKVLVKKYRTQVNRALKK